MAADDPAAPSPFDPAVPPSVPAALLDTNVLLWMADDDPRLTRAARAVVEDRRVTLWLSVASAWEIAIKASIGKLDLRGDDPEAFVARHVAGFGLRVLDIGLADALHTFALPLLHKDPFDRLLVAQARANALPIVTFDRDIPRYQVQIIR